MAKKKSDPVTHGNVFLTFVREATMIGNEVTLRREFMSARGLEEAFEVWAKARTAR